ncbi:MULTISPECIES: hypothetical protein [unclassified Archaeoglobus]|jgi:hypothetical protein|uniref:hypothetical protein n=1 Tax=unclassified Archaeoglobus TaxID=2643606 RepID=UPI0025BACD68|nr:MULTISPECIES: hypothetical protein [unclassified Archaeoglobus]
MPIKLLFFILISLCIILLLLPPIIKTGLEKFVMYAVGSIFIVGLAIILFAFVRIIFRILRKKIC